MEIVGISDQPTDKSMQRPLTNGGRITVKVVSSLTSLDLTNKENMLLFACSEAVEIKLVKLETRTRSYIHVRDVRKKVEGRVST